MYFLSATMPRRVAAISALAVFVSSIYFLSSACYCGKSSTACWYSMTFFIEVNLSCSMNSFRYLSRLMKSSRSPRIETVSLACFVTWLTTSCRPNCCIRAILGIWKPCLRLPALVAKGDAEILAPDGVKMPAALIDLAVGSDAAYPPIEYGAAEAGCWRTVRSCSGRKCWESSNFVWILSSIS